MRIPFLSENFGLKILALVLAIVTYQVLKREPSSAGKQAASEKGGLFRQDTPFSSQQ